MFKRILLLSFAVLLICASVSFAQTRIHNLPYTITSSGAYDIDTNLTSTGSGIIVRADNVTIDLNGFSIIGSGAGIGVDVGPSSNVEVRNGTITNFSTGVLDDEAPRGTRIINMGITNNINVGLVVDIGCIVKDSVVSGNGNNGIVAFSCIVQGNTVFENGNDGINSSQSIVINNNVYSNSGYGIRAQLSTIKNNYVQNNILGGMNVQQSLLDGNAAVGNTNYNVNTCANCAFGTNLTP